MKVDPIDVVFFVIILTGAVLIVVSQILKHKGIWDFYDAHREWSLKNLHSAGNRRGLDSPHAVTAVGVIVVAFGVIGEISVTFGLKAGALSVVVVGMGSIVFNVIRLKCVESDDEGARFMSVAGMIVSVCAVLIALFMIAMT